MKLPTHVAARAARPLRLCALALVLGASPALLLPTAAQAQDTAAVTGYDIAPGPLGSVLSQFAAAAGVTLTFESAQTAGQKSPGLKGRYSVEQGFDRLLAGSGLQVFDRGNGNYVLQELPKTAATVLGAVKVQAVVDDTRTEGSGSYTARAASAGTRLPLSPRETPQSVSVITRQQIEDRNFVTLDDAMEVATGITSSTANFNRISYTARGFTLTDNMIDGLPAVGNAYAGYVPNLAFYDRVEILRGSAGLIYGAGSAGGAVNLVRKRPTAEPQVSAVLRRGRWDNNYVELDGSRALNASGSVRGRLVISYEDRENFIDDEYTRRPAAYGIVEADLGDSTMLYAGGSMERYDGNYAPYGLPRYSDGRDLGLPRSSRGMAPAWNRYYTDVDTSFVGLEQRFGARWSLRLAANFQDRVQGGLTINSTGAVDSQTQRVASYGTTISDSSAPAEYSAYDLMLSGGFDLFGRAHELVVGATLSEVESKRSRSASGPAPAVPSTIFDFDPWSLPQPALGAWTRSATSSTNTNSGIYATTRLSLADPLKLILGARLSTVESENRNHDTGVTTKTEEKDAFSPFAGLIYDLAEQWSTYVSYADIFRAQNTSYTASGEPLEPAVGSNVEGGVKGEFYDGGLNLSFALFRIIEDKRSQVDPDHQQPCAGSPTNGDCFIAAGKVRGQGFETELAGELLPGLELTAGYTYVETEFLRDRTRSGEPSPSEGKAFRSTTPEHLFRLWGNYRLPGTLAAWSAGAGINAQSGIYAESNNIRVEQGGYTLYSARLGYRLDEHWSLGLNANNLFDKNYYLRIGTVNGNRYGEPRNLMVTVRGRF